MKVNRNNYEEFFILYLDNELTAGERLEVEAFAKEHTDLGAELELLLQSKLDPDLAVQFPNKEILLTRDSATIDTENYEQWLVAYVDEELTAEERNNVEQFLDAHPSLKIQLHLLQQVKLQPEHLVFADKQSLYRKEEKTPVIAIRWWRIAAAAVLIAAVTTTAIVMSTKDSASGTELAVTPEKTQKQTGTPEIKVENTLVTPAENTVAEIKNATTIGAENNGATAKKPVDRSADKSPDNQVDQKEETLTAKNDEKRPTNNLPQPEDNPYVKSNENNVIAYSDNKGNELPLTKIKETGETSPVTTQPVDTYNNSNTALVDSEIQSAEFASNNNGNGQKGGLRGFFRKVTRTFEKRTNIKATNDDDRLLIAGLAINLN